MKIRTLLLASVVTFSVILLIICGLVIVTNQQIQNLVSQEGIANRIALEAGEFGYLSNDYLMFRESQQAVRWNMKFVSVSGDIASLSVDQPEQKAILGNLKANLRNTRSVFDDIALNPLQTGGVTDTRFVQISWSRMAVQSQSLVFDARRLANLLHEESENLMQVRNLLVFSLMGVFIAFLLTSYFIFYRRALKSISLLNTGTKIIGSGNLNYAIETGTEDELGDLSQEINRMTADLRNVLASKTDLEREMSDRKQAEAQLVRNNENLNALNEELTATQEELQQNVDELSKREIEIHSVALFPTENPSPTMRINEFGILLFANPASSHVIGCWKMNVGEKVPDHIIRSAHDSLEHGMMHEAEEICEPFTYSIRFAPITTQNYINLYFSDITERKHAEAQLIRTNENLNALNEELVAAQEELHRKIKELGMAEKQLRESEERYRTVADFTFDWEFWIDPEGRFKYISPSADQIVGRPVSQFVSADELFHEIIHPDDLQTRLLHLTQEKAGQDHFEMEFRIIRPDGEVRWIHHVCRPIRDEKGKFLGTRGSNRDITERKQIEESLLESEEKYRLIFETANEGIWITDADRKTILVNKRMADMLGYSIAEMIGKTQSEYLVPDQEQIRLKTRDNLAKGVSIQTEFKFRRKDGSELWVISSASPVFDNKGRYLRTVSLLADITERKRAEEALLETEQRFRLALKNAPVSVAIQDTNLVFIWAYNQRTIKPEEIIGRTDTDIFIPEDATRLIELKRKVIETGKEAHEQIWLTMNGKRMYFDLYLEPLRNNTGQITGIGIATVDQTLEKLTEIALRDNEKRLREANDLLEAVTDATKVIIAAEDTNFRYTYFNKTYAAIIRRLTGKEIMTGMSMIDLFSDLPEEQRSELNEWSKVLNGQSVNERIKFDEQKKDPAIYNVLHVPLRDAKWEIIGAGEIAFDVTSQVKVEETLRETSQYLTNLIDYANAPIIVWDPRFRITLFNHAFEHLTGRKAKEVIGNHLEILLPENYLSPSMDLIQKTSEGERWESVEIPILHKKGTIRTVLWNSAAIFGSDGKTIVATIAQGQDITDRKKIESEYKLRAAEYAKMNVTLKEEISQRESAETNLKQTLSLLNASFESTADGILVVDREGRITGYNQNFVNMWNIPLDMEKTRDHRTLIKYFQSQIRDPEKFFMDMKDLLAHPVRESYDVIELTDGRIFERYSKPQKIGKTAVGRVWSYRDITDRRRSEERLVASLQEKEVLLREIHHRVKNNLQLVTGLLDMTRMRTRDEATTSILTDMMLKIQTMAQIHTRLYESKQFGKIGLTGQFRDQIIALSNIYSYKGHEICCEINAEEIFLPVDQALPCALVVNEILSNSYKHAFKGKTKGSIVISAIQENGEVRITVRDDGIGMPADFDIGRANSLGLKLIRTLVEHQLKGCLTINSLQGTETIIEFPIIIAGT